MLKTAPFLVLAMVGLIGCAGTTAPVTPPGSNPPAANPPAAGAALAAYAGTYDGWMMTNVTVETRPTGDVVTLKADGTYTMAPNGTGTYTVTGQTATFTGPLAAWNNGNASLTPKGAFAFQWNGGTFLLEKK
jgi:hypothetical protein